MNSAASASHMPPNPTFDDNAFNALEAAILCRQFGVADTA
jgi:hypothetical protein